MDKLEQAKKLRLLAARLEEEAHNERCLPVRWEVGMKVRFLNSEEWAWRKGDIGHIDKIRPESQGKLAANGPCFFGVVFPGARGVYFASSEDVEWIPEEGEGE